MDVRHRQIVYYEVVRKEPYTVGSYVHVIKRGSRGLDIVRDQSDRWRFLLMLYHLNDRFFSDNWFRDLVDEDLQDVLKRPAKWPKQEKLVSVLCFCLLNNHFHLLLKEIRDNGISLFMKRMGIAMAKHFNEKYKERGSLFQGAFRARTVKSDNHLRYVSAYIQVKNAFEVCCPRSAHLPDHFERNYKKAIHYPYCSLGDYAGIDESPVVDKELLGEIYNPKTYKSFCRDVIIGRYRGTADYSTLELE